MLSSYRQSSRCKNLSQTRHWHFDSKHYCQSTSFWRNLSSTFRRRLLCRSKYWHESLLQSLCYEMSIIRSWKTWRQASSVYSDRFRPFYFAIILYLSKSCLKFVLLTFCRIQHFCTTFETIQRRKVKKLENLWQKKYWRMIILTSKRCTLILLETNYYDMNRLKIFVIWRLLSNVCRFWQTISKRINVCNILIDNFLIIYNSTSWSLHIWQFDNVNRNYQSNFENQ